MKLKDLFKPYLDFSEEEKGSFINELRSKRIPLPIIKKERKSKKKVDLTDAETELLNKILGALKK